jgi:hypothetical protein
VYIQSYTIIALIPPPLPLPTFTNRDIGPYAPSILRFHISFPPTYPSYPPLITLSTDIFHPLVTPLTTYMYTTSAPPEGTVSATDDERLPPGGFSLRDGFPDWFDRRTRSQKKQMSTYDVLRYVRSTFDDAEVLDKVPLAAAGNPGAWHAWRCHRVKEGIIFPSEEKDKGDPKEGESDADSVSSRGGPDGHQRLSGGSSAPMASRRPGEWNWDGVWEVRVKKGTEGSISEGTLFGRDAGDDLIHFLNLDADQYETIKENLMRSLETVAPQRRGVV